MSTVTASRQIDLSALPFPASQTWDGTTSTVTADVPAAELRGAVDGAPTPVDPVALSARLEAVEARLDRAASAAVTGDAAKLRDNLKTVL